MAYLHSLVIGLTVLGLVIDALSRRLPLLVPPLETWHRLWVSGGYGGLVCRSECRGGASGKRTMAELASKRALVNENGRIDVMRCVRWDTFNRRTYFIHPSNIRLANYFHHSSHRREVLPHTTQPTVHVLPLTTFNYMLHTVGENSLEHASSQRSSYTISSSSPQLSIKYDTFLGIYTLTTLQLRIKASFRWT